MTSVKKNISKTPLLTKEGSGVVSRKILLQNLRIYWNENNVPNITDENADFLTKLLQEKQVKNLLEIGTANGYSAIVFWDVLEKIGGSMLSIDFSAKSHGLAIQNIADAGLDDTVELVLANALEFLPTLKESYDFVFIDGMKRRTLDFLQLVWDKVPVWGTIVVDDVIKFREKMVWFYEYVEEQNMNYEVLKIDSDDGIMIIRK